MCDGCRRLFLYGRVAVKLTASWDQRKALAIKKNWTSIKPGLALWPGTDCERFFNDPAKSEILYLEYLSDKAGPIPSWIESTKQDEESDFRSNRNDLGCINSSALVISSNELPLESLASTQRTDYHLQKMIDWIFPKSLSLFPIANDSLLFSFENLRLHAGIILSSPSRNFSSPAPCSPPVIIQL